jgi:iron complex outermembrane recepter protein
MRAKSIGCVLAATLPSVVAFSAYGQQEGLEEIVVTATRREENLQQVPISIVAVTGDSLEMRGLDSLERVSQAIPNLVITGGGGGTSGTNFTVRGIPNVGTYVDGVWQVGTAGLLTQEFVDIDRIEVLRGPQGTTFGRDSTGGAIRIWTKKPSQDFGADLTGTIGSLDRRDVKASVNIPVADKLLTKWTIADLYRDGYVHDLTTGLNNGGVDQKVFHGDILWMPTDKLTWRFNYQTDNNQFTEPRIQDAVFHGTLAEAGQAVGSIDLYGLAGQEPFNAQTQTAGYPGGVVGEWQDRSEISLPNTIETKQFSSDVTWDVGNTMKLQFITAQTFQEVHSIVDWDNSQYQLVEDVNQNRLRVTSQEVQLSGGTDRVKWVGGVYYWRQMNLVRGFTRYQLEEFLSGLYDINTAFNSPTCLAVQGGPLTDCQGVYANAVGPGGRADSLTQYTQDGSALFGEATISITKKLDLTVGLRHHTQNDDVLPLNIVPGLTAPRPASANQRFEGDVFYGTSVGQVDTPSSFDKNTARLSLQDQFSDNLMGYIGYSEGFNSGGATAFTDPSDGLRKISQYKPQTLKNTEIGIRSDLANKHLRLNATLFNTVWEDVQALGPVLDAQGHQLPSLNTTNVGSARARGAELEMTIVPTEKLLFNVNVGTLDTAYTSIRQGALFLDTNSAFQQAPEHTGSLGFQYNASLNKGSSLITRLDYLYQSQFWRSLTFLRTSFWAPAVPADFDESGGSGITNLRITYEPGNADWNLAVFGTNLSNERLINSGFFHGIWAFDFATVGRPREFGVQLNFKLK